MLTFFVCLLDDLALGFFYSSLTRETGRETLELQANRLTRCASHPKKNIFPIKNLGKIPTPEPTPEPIPKSATEPTMSDNPKPSKEQTKKFSFKLYGNFLNIIANDKTNINPEIFAEYFKYQKEN